MKMDEIKAIAKQRGINPAKMKKGDLIRAIQADERNQQCFETRQKKNCGQDSCIWQWDCD